MATLTPGSFAITPLSFFCLLQPFCLSFPFFEFITLRVCLVLVHSARCLELDEAQQHIPLPFCLFSALSVAPSFSLLDLDLAKY